MNWKKTLLAEWNKNRTATRKLGSQGFSDQCPAGGQLKVHLLQPTLQKGRVFGSGVKPQNHSFLGTSSKTGVLETLLGSQGANNEVVWNG